MNASEEHLNWKLRKIIKYFISKRNRWKTGGSTKHNQKHLWYGEPINLDQTFEKLRNSNQTTSTIQPRNPNNKQGIQGLSVNWEKHSKIDV